MKATFPSVFWDEGARAYKCEMRDKKTGRTWGYGYGTTREEAIYNARLDQPKQHRIKKIIGWVSDHPFLAGAAAGAYLQYRRARYHHSDIRPIDIVKGAVVAGLIAWGISTVFKYVKRKFFSNY